MLAMQNDYLDVFMPTGDYKEATAMWGAIFGISVAVWFATYGWLFSGMPGFPDISHKAHERFVAGVGVFIAILTVVMFGSGITSGFLSIKESIKTEKIRDNMEQNVEKKYNANLGSSRELPKSEDRDKPHSVSLTFKGEDGKSVGTQTYQIRFDLTTNEPFISDADAPRADELEKAAKK
jgi:hypothetical protein